MQSVFIVVSQFDSWVTHSAQSLESPLLTSLMLSITFLGNPLFWMLVTSAVYWQGNEKKALYLAMVTLFSAVLVAVLKPVFARPRPSVKEFKRLTTDFYSPLSFPSGHSTLISAYWAFLTQKSKKAIIALFFVFVLLVAFSRVYLGVHFATDVIGGIVFGALIGKATGFLEGQVKHKHLKPTRLLDSLAIAMVLAIGLLALLFLENIPLAAALIGFFGGFFLSEQIEFDSPILKGKPLIVKETIGFFVILLIFLAIPYVTSLKLPFGLGQHGQTRLFLCYALIGLWVSFVWPMLYQKFFGKARAES